MGVAFEMKKDKYAELAAECSQVGWRAFTVTLEVECRGYIGVSTLLKSLGIRDMNLKRARSLLKTCRERGASESGSEGWTNSG